MVTALAASKQQEMGRGQSQRAPNGSLQMHSQNWQVRRFRQVWKIFVDVIEPRARDISNTNDCDDKTFRRNHRRLTM